MKNKSVNVQAEVVLTSLKPINNKPDFASVGGFATVDGTGKSTYFDWQEYSGEASIQEDSKLRLEFSLKDFDLELFQTSNEVSDIPDWNKITSNQLLEVYYEAGYNKNGEDVLEEMKLTSFVISIKNENSFVKKQFSQEQIDSYNEKNIESKWIELSNIPFEYPEDTGLSDMSLSDDWFIFSKSTERETIWKWFDQAHSKGVHWLLYQSGLA